MENAYEGKGEINAGEEIPLRVYIKHVDYPDLDLMEFFYYWGARNKTGNTELQVKFEVENISTVPKSLLDQLKLEKYPPEKFSENLRVKSFKDKGIYNMLWVPKHPWKVM